MKSRWIRGLALALCLSLLLSFAVIAADSSDPALESFEGYIAENMIVDCATREIDYAKHAAANDAYQFLWTGLALNPERNEFYGGAYINDEDDLVICLTTDDALVQQTFCSMIPNYTPKFQLVEKTYEELCEAQDQIFNSMKESADDATSTFSVTKNVQANSIKVSAEDLTDTTATMQNTYNITVAYEVMEEPIESFVTIRPGTGLDINGSGLSVGVRCYRNSATGTSYGFTTAGHQAPVGATVKNSFGTIVGEVKARSYPNAGGSAYADVSFVEKEGTVNAENTTGTGDLISTVNYSPVDNAVVHVCGSHTVARNITIYDASGHTQYDGRDFYNVLCMNNSAAGVEQGDSGGLVYLQYSNQVAGFIMSGNYTDFYATNIQYAKSALSLNLY